MSYRDRRAPAGCVDVGCSKACPCAPAPAMAAVHRHQAVGR